ncbi:hypothetical protein BY458DRAFT_429524 [Sporodiniella umbellata]|nr:hypothetical protein BY458DRAFT_429524 [Sporodiniella umbellata]
MKIEYEEKMKVYQKYEQGGFFESVISEPKPVEMSDSESSVVDIQFDSVLKFKSTMKKIIKERRKITEAAEELGRQRAQTQV